MWDPYAGFEQVVLPNGLSLYVNHWPGRPFEAFEFIVHSGALADKSGKEGTAHFLEHVVNRNTTRDQEEFEKYLENQGGQGYFGGTNLHETRYRCFLPTKPEVLDQSIKFFGDMLLDGVMQQGIEEERATIQAEIRRQYPTDYQLSEHTVIFGGLLGEEHRMAHSGTIGTPASVSAISSDDLQAFYDKWYTPANMSVVAVGGLDRHEVTRLVSRSSFAREKAGSRFLSAPASKLPLPQTRMIKRSARDTMTTAIDRAFVSISALLPGEVTDYAIPIFRTLLHDQLFDRLRKQRQWVYAIEQNILNLLSCRVYTVSIKGLSLEGVDSLELILHEALDAVATDEEGFLRERHRRVVSINSYDMTAKGVADRVADDLSLGYLITSTQEAEDEIASTPFARMAVIRELLRPERLQTYLLVP